ncbi:universal stress protein [Dyella sp. ASV21]|jgi:nucleotide-binding universal stress UspA family protein|uniref:universal stress protein n=1 Tax=Dyella sp. ASV21 TaxID=2795114 RepID=UPI0018ED5002|nr:universal stress protein [Dyella sp. ASV21]
MFKHILVPIDDSEPSRRAAEAAIALAHACRASLTALSVILPERAESYVWDTHGRRSSDVGAAMDICLDGVQQAADAAGVPCTCRRSQAGEPWDAIVQAAHTYDCDLIVMGTHARGGLARVLLGSQAQSVLSHTNTPVLVCPP